MLIKINNVDVVMMQHVLETEHKTKNESMIKNNRSTCIQ